ncbi:MAG: C40 family peptidase [Bacilli bacterium]|nr:C40 family peptidase [Bacilli bacterium]
MTKIKKSIIKPELTDLKITKPSQTDPQKINHVINAAAEEIIDFTQTLVSTPPQTIGSEYINFSNMSAEEIEHFFNLKNQELTETLAGCNGTRERAVAAAVFLATNFPKLPYFWGGGHSESYEEMLGINRKLGSSQIVTEAYGEEYIQGQSYTYGYDCSGFVSWCLINAGYPNFTRTEVVRELNNIEGSQRIGIASEGAIEKVKPGDLAIIGDSHIGIVIDVNKETNEITIAHESGSGGGMNITTQSTLTGKITADDLGSTNDINQNNKEIQPRIDQNYFTEIVLMDYPD